MAGNHDSYEASFEPEINEPGQVSLCRKGKQGDNAGKAQRFKANHARLITFFIWVL